MAQAWGRGAEKAVQMEVGSGALLFQECQRDLARGPSSWDDTVSPTRPGPYSSLSIQASPGWPSSHCPLCSSCSGGPALHVPTLEARPPQRLLKCSRALDCLQRAGGDSESSGQCCDSLWPKAH